MRKLVNLLVRQDGLSHEEFVEYWLNEHAPLAEELQGVTKYATSVPADPEKAAYDGIAELYLEDETTVGDVFASEAGERIQADTENFLDEDAGEILVVDETVQFAADTRENDRDHTMTRARIAGTGMTPFGEHTERTGRDLFGEAALAALDDAGLTPDDVDEVFYGNFVGTLSENQGHQGPLMSEAFGSTAPAKRIEGACASSGLAIRDAVRIIRNGEADVVVAGGMERMTNMGTAGATEGLAVAADDLYEVRAGVTFPAAYALMARAYFAEFGGDETDLAHIAVKNHDNALANDHAHLQTEITLEDVASAPSVADPLGLYDACPISDGASAVVLTTDAYAETHDLAAPIAITGSGQGGDRTALQDRHSFARTPATREAAQEAYADAGLTPDAVDFAEVHDCFTIAEVLALEALDLYEDGEAIGAARRGETIRDGELPVNLSGGLKAKGHPVGATGTAQVAAVASLLAGTHARADALDEPDVGVAQNAGGTVASATVHVLEVVA